MNTTLNIVAARVDSENKMVQAMILAHHSGFQCLKTKFLRYQVLRGKIDKRRTLNKEGSQNNLIR
jgi:hypothetical protein